MITADWEEFTKLSHSETLAFHHRKPGEGGTRSFRSTIVFNPFRCFRFNNHASEALACDALHSHMGFFLLAAMVLALVAIVTGLNMLFTKGFRFREAQTERITSRRLDDEVRYSVEQAMRKNDLFSAYYKRFFVVDDDEDDDDNDERPLRAGDIVRAEGLTSCLNGRFAVVEQGADAGEGARTEGAEEGRVTVAWLVWSTDPAEAAVRRSNDGGAPVRDATTKKGKVKAEKLRLVTFEPGTVYESDLVRLFRVPVDEELMAVPSDPARRRYRYRWKRPLACFASCALLLVGLAWEHACPAHREDHTGLGRPGGCFSFEGVLTHEVGHLLGIHHPDGGFRLDTNRNASVHDYVPIDAGAPCEGLRVFSQEKECASVPLVASRSVRRGCSDYHNCRLVPATVAAHPRCKSIFEDTIMFSRRSPQSMLNEPTQHDLAALFFLYPDKHRDPTIGTRALPLSSFTSAKLRSLAEDFQGGLCSSLADRRALLECLRGRKAQGALENAQAMADEACGAVASSVGGFGPKAVLQRVLRVVNSQAQDSGDCEKLSAVARSMEAGLQVVRNFVDGGGGGGGGGSKSGECKAGAVQGRHGECADRAEAGAPEASAAEISGDLARAQQEAEDELSDRPNVYTPSATVDAIIDTLLEEDDGDLNEDGVRDSDRDRDGLPDDVEDGIDVLRELLAEIESGEYHGRWDHDGDGTPNSEDDDFEPLTTGV